MIRVIILFLIARFECFAHYDPAYFHNERDGFKSRRNWMSGIRNEVRLSEIALPGTHDSENRIYTDNWNCQCLTIDDQLKYGIRVFEITLRFVRNNFFLQTENDKLKDFTNLNLFAHVKTFDNFLNQVESFLIINPSEVVFIRLKSIIDGNSNERTLRESFESYFSSSNYITYLKTKRNGITIGEARGRFVILCDTGFCIDYGINFGYVNVQNNFFMRSNWDLYVKWENVREFLQLSAFGDRHTFYISYLTASGGSFPYFVASGHRNPGTSDKRLSTAQTTPEWENSYPDFPRVDCFLGICTIAFEGLNTLARDKIASFNVNDVGFRTIGIIMADFPGDELIEKIIMNNRHLQYYTRIIR
jgi:1-phosphatidylinositol phosphodiesterase